MRNAGFLFLILAGLLILIGIIPDRSEKVEFSFKGEDIVERISSDYVETPVFTGSEEIKDYLRNSNLGILLQFPKNIIQGRKGHVEVTALLSALAGEDQNEGRTSSISTCKSKPILNFPDNSWNRLAFTKKRSPGKHPRHSIGTCFPPERNPSKASCGST